MDLWNPQGHEAPVHVDLLTKYLDSNTIDQHVKRINLHVSSHRLVQAPLLTNLNVLNGHRGNGVFGINYNPCSKSHYIRQTMYWGMNTRWFPAQASPGYGSLTNLSKVDAKGPWGRTDLNGRGPKRSRAF